MRVERLLLLLIIALPGRGLLSAAEVPFFIHDLFVEQEVPLTDIAINGTSYVVDGTIVNTAASASNVNWSFAETDMVGLSTQFNNNRHEFMFSNDGMNPITVNSDEHWRVSFDIALNGTLLSPRKAVNFVVFDGGSQTGAEDSFINLTTNRSPNTNGLSDPPGESAMFGGEYNFVRLIGPEDGDPSLNLNPTVNYVGGDTVSLEIIHTPSPDGGTTPSTVEHIYDDGTGPYTTGPRDLRRSGVFADGAKLGFIIQGIAHSGTPVDSHTVDISDLQLTIGTPECTVSGDLDCSGQVGADDLDLVLMNWGAPGTPPPAGWVHDLPVGNIGADELDTVLMNWGGMALGAAVPEPSTGLLGVFGFVLLLRRRS